MQSIFHRRVIEAAPEKVYEALTTQEGLSGSWTPHTKAKPEIGSIARFAFGPDYFKEMEVVNLEPYSRVKWRCIKGIDKWMDTLKTNTHGK